MKTPHSKRPTSRAGPYDRNRTKTRSSVVHEFSSKGQHEAFGMANMSGAGYSRGIRPPPGGFLLTRDPLAVRIPVTGSVPLFEPGDRFCVTKFALSFELRHTVDVDVRVICVAMNGNSAGGDGTKCFFDTANDLTFPLKPGSASDLPYATEGKIFDILPTSPGHSYGTDVFKAGVKAHMLPSKRCQLTWGRNRSEWIEEGVVTKTFKVAGDSQTRSLRYYFECDQNLASKVISLSASARLHNVTIECFLLIKPCAIYSAADSKFIPDSFVDNVMIEPYYNYDEI